VITQLALLCPQLELRVLCGATGSAKTRVLQAMARQAADLGIFEASVGTDIPWPTHPYRNDTLALLVPATHPLAKRASATLEQFLDGDIVGLEDGSAMVMTLERQAAEAGRVLRLRARVGSYDSMAAMVAQGVGIGVMPSAVAQQAARNRALRCVPIREAWAARRFLLCTQPDDVLSSAARSIAALLAHTQNANPGSAK
jgi:DNA-binding transcriptional LysR family regulator